MNSTQAFTESNRLEYKRQLTDSLEKEVVAFLNDRDGGIIYIGIDDKTGKACDLDDVDAIQLKVKDRIRNNIRPSTMGLFDVIIKITMGVRNSIGTIKSAS